MRIERRNTTEGQSPYAGIDFRLTTSEIRNPDGSVVFRLENVEVPEFWSQVASDVLAQKYFRKAGVAARLKKVEEETVPSWLWRSVPDTEALADLPEIRALCQRALGQAGVRPPRRLLDLLGLEGRLFLHRRKTPAPSTTSCATCWRSRWCAPNSPQWFNTGLHWAYGVDGPGQGHYYVDLEDRQADQVEIGLRASAAARLLHPGRRGRPRQRGRHHGPLGARGAPVQIRLRHRLQLLAAARRRRKAVRRRPLLAA